MRAERQLDDDPDDDPPVAAPERVGVLRGTVVGPVRAEHPPAPAAEQGVVDDHLDRRVRVEQPGHDQPRQRQAEPIGIPGMRRDAWTRAGRRRREANGRRASRHHRRFGALHQRRHPRAGRRYVAQADVHPARLADEASRELMKQLGLNFFDAKGNFIGLEKSAGLLSTKLNGLTQEQRNNALATIFGSDSMRVAAILADQGAAGFDKMAKAVGRQGAATELAAAQNAGFNGALDNFKSTLETLAIDLGTKLLPPVTKFLQVLTDKLPAAVDFVSSHFAGLGGGHRRAGGGGRWLQDRRVRAGLP